MDPYNLIIIGGGPTGLNCAIAAEKAGLSYVVLEKGVLVNSIYHFPVNMTFFSTSKLLEIVDTPFISHGEKPTRREALEYYRRLQQSYKLNVHTYEAVQRMERQDDGLYHIFTSKGEYPAHSVIIATGFYDTPRLMDVPGENLPKVKHYYDDAHPYVGQKVLVVGAANSACQVALEIWRKGAEVAMAIRDDKIYTPELTSCLDGITRATIFTLAEELGYTIHEKRITRDEVYICDEAFFTGTAAEVVPIRELDGRTIGSGSRGPLTEKLQGMYFDTVRGKRSENSQWLEPVA